MKLSHVIAALRESTDWVVHQSDDAENVARIAANGVASVVVRDRILEWLGDPADMPSAEEIETRWQELEQWQQES